MFRKADQGYSFGKEKCYKYLLFIDDLKLHGCNVNEIYSLVQTVKVAQRILESISKMC